MPPSNFTARVAAVFLLLPLGLAIAACERSESQTKAAPPPPTVTVARPVTKTVVDQDEYVGRFVAVDAVEVRARVSGYLEKIHFQDGQLINKGDLLFTVDRRPFQNALDQARASLAQAKANLAFAEADLARGQNLLGGNIIIAADVRAAHAGQARRARPTSPRRKRRCGRRSSTWSSPSCARPCRAASAIGAFRPAIS